MAQNLVLRSVYPELLSFRSHVTLGPRVATALDLTATDAHPTTKHVSTTPTAYASSMQRKLVKRIERSIVSTPAGTYTRVLKEQRCGDMDTSKSCRAQRII